MKNSACSNDSLQKNAQYTKAYVFILFFLFGGITSLNSIITPKLQSIFSLTYFQSMLVESVFFACYFLFSIPAEILIQKCGYMRSTCVGLLIMASGCILFTVTSKFTVFYVFLIALYVLAIGVVIIQVVTNPLISRLGPPETATSRLTFAHTFNSLGTTIFPYISSIFILGNLSNNDAASILDLKSASHKLQESNAISKIYLLLAIFTILIALFCWMKKDILPSEKNKKSLSLKMFNLLKNTRFALGTLCIFLYVGAEVTIGSVMVNYLMLKDTLNLNGISAGQHTAFYWGSAMIGRFIGCWLLSRHSAAKILSAFATIAFSLVIISSQTTGMISGWSLIAVGLFNSIMFPTIFSLANVGLNGRSADGSGIICTAISGGFIVPLLSGYVADIVTLREALFIPSICYVIIVGYGIYCLKSKGINKTYQ